MSMSIEVGVLELEYEHRGLHVHETVFLQTDSE